MSARTTMETTPAGLWFDFANPRPEQIDLDDIATSLSHVCRFGGHISLPHYSVAEHACLVQGFVIEAGHPELAPEALHHDDHETYTGDLPTPLKNYLEEAGVYRPLVDSIDQAIATKLGLDASLFHHPVIVAADRLALRWEASVVKKSRGIEGAWEWRELPDIPEDWLPGWNAEYARRAFLDAHDRIVVPW